MFLDSSRGDWQSRVKAAVDTLREMSEQTDPEAMVTAYRERIGKFLPTDRMVSLSRRNLQPPRFCITRSTLWKEPINPWREPHRLPVLDRGLLHELLYAGQPRIIHSLQPSADDPAAPYFEGMGSLIALPLFDRGEALNMVVLMRREKRAFDEETLPIWLMMTGLFGRATTNLVLSEQLKKAYEEVDQELRTIAQIQRSLLPRPLPRIETLDLAAHYETARRAGGDYYDFFRLPDNKWGILIADVSGHGSPAAVMMAITHSLAHAHPGPHQPPGAVLGYLNNRLAKHYTGDSGTFVTAFYGVYDATGRAITYASAGHNPPRIKRCEDGSLCSLDGAAGLPLGIMESGDYEETTRRLRIGDQIIFYTDGITEACNPAGEMFGLDRLDASLERCQPGAAELVSAVLRALADFAHGEPAADDQTLLVAKVI